MDSLLASMRHLLSDWQTLRVDGLLFRHMNVAALILSAFFSIAVLKLAFRSATHSGRPRQVVALPALLTSIQGSRWSFVRYLVMVLYVAGFFCLIASVDTQNGHFRDGVHRPPGGPARPRAERECL